MSGTTGLSYESAGVNYDHLDAFKRACQAAARTTVTSHAPHGYREPENIRGDSAFLLEGEHDYLAHVEEGLGTKNLVADAVLALTGKSFYANIGIDTVATIVNDLITCGGLPISVAMHAAVGAGEWFNDPRRGEELAKGFAAGCIAADAVWGGGETPALKGIVNPETIVLAGSAIGRVFPKSHRIAGDVHEGNAIIFLASTGVQTNGLTLCRALADQLPDGYRTKIEDGRPYGEALLDASAIYVKFVAALQHAKLQPKYLAHVTGHGWRKLMRLPQNLVYRIDHVREPLPVFKFIAKAGQINASEMYGTFNMGVGFAAYVKDDDADRCIAIAQHAGYEAWRAGTVHKQGERKAVEIPSLGLIYEGNTLNLR